MKITVQSLRLIAPVSFRIAWLISRACKPTWESPISPSISALGIRAATESTTITLVAFERTSSSQISSACSPVSGWETNISSTLTPMRRAHVGSNACSASMNATTPPAFWASAAMVKASVVLPLDSGPNTSTMRPLGTPRPPKAKSKLREPVPIPGGAVRPSPSRRMIEPLPYVFSIWARARSSAAWRPADSASGAGVVFFLRAAMAKACSLLFAHLIQSGPLEHHSNVPCRLSCSSLGRRRPSGGSCCRSSIKPQPIHIRSGSVRGQNSIGDNSDVCPVQRNFSWPRLTIDVSPTA